MTGEWADRAKCRGMESVTFFPRNLGLGRGQVNVSEAVKVCEGCEVRIECLEFADRNGERFGVWGGLTVRQRQRRRAKMKKEG